MRWNRQIAQLATVLTVVFSVHKLMSKETPLEKAQATRVGVANRATGGVRNLRDELCEAVNGKMKCLKDKVKHKAENTSDILKAKKTELENKVD
jgi:hypothetical protein